MMVIPPSFLNLFSRHGGCARVGMGADGDIWVCSGADPRRVVVDVSLNEVVVSNETQEDYGRGRFLSSFVVWSIVCPLHAHSTQ